MSTERSYAQILKASSIMGGAAGIKMLLGMLQVKFAAVLIGTAGVGLIASFTALQGLISGLAGLGIQSSAVREIAAAVGKGDQDAIGHDAIIISVGHARFRELGAADIRALGKPQNVLFDVKGVLPRDAVDGRL